MSKYQTNYQEVQSLYELCTTGTDLKEFCHDSGVNYPSFLAWQRKQLWNHKLGKSTECCLPSMSAVSLTDVPQVALPSVLLEKAAAPLPSIRFIQIKLSDGFSIQKYNTSIEEVSSLLTKLSLLSC